MKAAQLGAGSTHARWSRPGAAPRDIAESEGRRGGPPWARYSRCGLAFGLLKEADGGV
jgi:hypothetical protein